MYRCRANITVRANGFQALAATDPLQERRMGRKIGNGAAFPTSRIGKRVSDESIEKKMVKRSAFAFAFH